MNSFDFSNTENHTNRRKNSTNLYKNMTVSKALGALHIVSAMPECKKSNNIIIDFVEIEVVNIDLTEIVLVIIDLYYNIELIETRRCI